MATIFSIGPVGKDGLCTVRIRVQCRVPRVDVKQNTPLKIAEKVWNSAPGSLERQKFCSNPKIRRVFDNVEDIRAAIFSKLEGGVALGADDVREIVDSFVFREQRIREAEEAAEKRRQEELERKMTLRKYIDLYRSEIKSGKRLTEKGTRFSPGTCNAVNQACERLRKFEREMGRIYDFDDIDMDFYRDYLAYLNGQDYAANTSGKCINVLKTILASALAEGFSNNCIFKDKKFHGSRVDVESIYLTREDLDKIRAVDLSGRSYGFELARDIFLIGVWTAQRVSDYNNIQRSDIETYLRRYIDDVPAGDGSGRMVPVVREKEIAVINFRQKKTGTKVAIPCSTELKRILEKYDYSIPRLSDQNINDNIKEIALEAGLTELIKITGLKGGTMVTEMVPKYKLVHSHTARRTGATLMYLSGMDIFDIMKVTGHSTPQMLKKYIKADELEVVDKLVGKYNYFD